ncbi:hypothetical protein E4U54_001226 [Claviceps lovelessii]|nr:hypothetical protein E4U54_001226 [Claviceps lovelessii]
MDDKNIIARIYPAPTIGFKNFAHHAIKASRDYVAPSRRDDDELSETESQDLDVMDDIPFIDIRFDNPPASKLGITFGCSPKCHVQLPKRGGFSNHHFAVTFDDQGRLIVIDPGSTSGTQVKYDSQASGFRSNFRWIIAGDECVEKMDIIVFARSHRMKFRIVPVERGVISLPYLDKVKTFKQGTATGEDLIEDMDLNVPLTEAASVSHTLAQGPFYLKKVIGRGGFGVVTRCFNVSDGCRHALKEPTEEKIRICSVDPAERSRMFKIWRREAEVMERLSHVSMPLDRLTHRHNSDVLQPHLLKLINATFDPWPQLELEFMPHGSLTFLADLKVTETKQVAIQSLSALVYLHAQGLAHRDISPNNILVKTRHPLHIVLADFGLSKDAMELITKCGTEIYSAPEIFDPDYNQNYTTAVDVWSLGVVIVRCLHLLPSASRYGKLEKPGVHHQLAWCSNVVDAVVKSYRRFPDRFRGFLLAKMLLMRPEGRGTAQSCLDHIVHLSDEVAKDRSSHDCRDGDVLWREYSVHSDEDEDDELSDCTTVTYKEGSAQTIKARPVIAEASAHDNDEPAEPFNSSQRPSPGSAAPPPSQSVLEPNDLGLKRRISETTTGDHRPKRRGRASTSEVDAGPDS